MPPWWKQLCGIRVGGLNGSGAAEEANGPNCHSLGAGGKGYGLGAQRNSRGRWESVTGEQEGGDLIKFLQLTRKH